MGTVGDFGFFVGIMILWASLKTFNFGEVFAGIEQGKLSGGLLTAAGILVFCGEGNGRKSKDNSASVGATSARRCSFCDT